MKLIRFSEISEAQYLVYIKEWESRAEIIVPNCVARKNEGFTELQEKWRADELQQPNRPEIVPSTLYFLIDAENRIVGAIAFRHYLNEKLLVSGGHIGYGVRFTERKKGYASIMLGMLLEKLKNDSNEKYLLTCDNDNTASYKTIESCNGVLENIIEDEGKLKRRYWISKEI